MRSSSDRSASANALAAGRLGVVDDVAGFAVMLASRAGEFITGQTIVIDGGTTIGGFE